MTGQRRALLAAAAVEAAAGLAAASWADALGSGSEPITVFMACTLAAALADMVLIPACVWVLRPRMPWHLLGRTIAAAVTLAVAIWVAIWTTAGMFMLGSVLFGRSAAGDSAGLAMLCVPFLVAGAIVGLGAAAVDRASWRPGDAKARWTSHVVGGVAGVTLVLALAVLPALDVTTRLQKDWWWLLLVLAPAVLVLGGGVRNALMARDAVRSGTALTDSGRIARRAAACCLLLLALAAAAPLVPA